MNNHKNVNLITELDGISFALITKDARYPNKMYLFAGVFNSLQQFVPIIECMNYRQNAWNTNDLQGITENMLKQWAMTAKSEANRLITLSYEEVDAVFSVRYRQKMTASRKSAMIARAYTAESLGNKTMTKLDFANNIVHLAIHGGCPKTETLFGDSWKIVRVYRALADL